MTADEQEILWVLRAQCSDREALEALLGSVQSSLQRYIWSVVGRERGDDVLQDVLILLFRKLGALQDPKLFRPWAFRIASRACFKQLRKDRRSIENAADIALDEVPGPEWRPPESGLLDILNTDALTPACRAVLVLHFQEEMTLVEVAAILEVPLGTVKSRLSYGLAALRRHLDTIGVHHG